MYKYDKILFLFILLSLIHLTIFAYSTRIDSLKHELNTTHVDSLKLPVLADLIFKLRSIDNDESFLYIKQLEKLAIKLGSRYYLGEAYYSYGYNYYIKGLYETALTYCKKALKTFKELDNTEKMVRVLTNLGSIYWVIEQNDISFKFYLEAFQKCIRSEKKEFLAGATLNMGLTHRQIGNLDSAQYYYTNGIKLAEAQGDKYCLAVGALNLGYLFLIRKDYPQTLKYFNLARSYLSELPPHAKCLVYHNIGRYYFHTGNYFKAELYLDSAKVLKSKISNPTALKDYYKARFEFDTTKGDYKQAIKSLMSSVNIKDSLQDQDITQKLAQFRTIYDLDKKESELLIFQEREKLSKQKIKAQKKIISLSITAFVLLFIFSIVLFRLFKAYQKLNKKLDERQKKLARKNTILLKHEKDLKESNESKNVLFSIVAHDIKNPLYSMLRLSDVLENKYDKHTDEKRKKYLKMLNLAGKELVTLIENLLSWSRLQLGNIKYQPTPFTIHDVATFATGFFKHMADLKEINMVVDVDKTSLVYADFYMIVLVIRNITNNAIKYTDRKGQIIISSKIMDFFVRVEIADNGMGMDKKIADMLFRINQGSSKPGTEGEKGTGLGLAICKEFIVKNKGQIGVDSEPGKGSTFWFTVPVFRK